MSRKIARLVVLAISASMFPAVLVAQPQAGAANAKILQESELKLHGLRQPVSVYRDLYGVPYISAKNDHDLFIALGYVTAEDRLFQIDNIRRQVSGRLAEIRGSEFVDSDRYYRTLGFKQIADETLKNMDAETQRTLEQFSDGINAYIVSHRENLPVEFKKLDYRPEPWNPVDSIMCWQVIGYGYGIQSWQGKVARGEMLTKFGERAKELFPKSDTSATILQAGDMSFPSSSRATLPPSPPTGLLAYDQIEGSNNWVVSGKKSVTGSPLLASDPHVPITAPSMWYQVHVIGGHYNFTGIAMSGTPFVLIGHNANIAWGLTFSTIDSTDVFEERVNPSNLNQYEYLEKWETMQVRHETIQVKGGQPVTLDARATRHGPVVSEFANVKGKDYSIRWTNYDLKRDELHALRLINAASNWEQFKAGAKLYNMITANFVYGDRAGNIGYYLAAAIPIRKNLDGTLLPVPGWTNEHDWTGYVPFDEQPHVYNPARGWIATANNKVAGDWYPYFLSNPGNTRAERIQEVLQSKNKLSLDDFKALQSDVTSTQPPKIVPLLLAAFEGKKTSPEVSEALVRLRGWKYDFPRDGIAATIYDGFYRHLQDNTFLDDVGGDRKMLAALGLQNADLASLLKDHPNSEWFDDVSTPQKETATDILIKSLEQTVAELRDEYGPDQQNWQWEQKNTAVIPHEVPTGTRIAGPMFPEFSLGPYRKEGRSGWTVDPVGANSFRMVVDLDNLDNTQTQLAPGVSGDPLNPHYKDQVDLWLQGRYRPDYFSSEKIIQNATSVEIMKP